MDTESHVYGLQKGFSSGIGRDGGSCPSWVGDEDILMIDSLIIAAQLLTPHQLHVLHLKHMAHVEWVREQEREERAYQIHAGNKVATVTHTSWSPSGTLGCSGLETLWKSAGGNPGAAFTAAEIAMAESGGNQYAISPTNDYGYWQINGSHGPALATLNAYGNARAAIIISNNGTDWYPWTTYVTGAYIGRCLYNAISERKEP